MKKLALCFMIALVFLSGATLITACDDTQYQINVVQNDHGQIFVDKALAKEGEKIEIHSFPDEGYQLTTLFLNGKELGQNNFVMPNYDVTINGFFAPIISEDQAIQLKTGTYCGVSAISDKLLYPESSTITINLDNTFDVVIARDTDFYRQEGVIYQTQNNKICAKLYADVTITILDETRFAFSDGENILIFAYQEPIEIPEGKYNADYLEIDEQDIDLSLDIHEDYAILNSQALTLNNERLDFEICGKTFYATFKGKTYSGYISMQHIIIGAVREMIISNLIGYDSGKAQIIDGFFTIEIQTQEI